MQTKSNSIFKLHYPVIAPLIMCSGVGDGKTTACVMAQAATIDALRKGKTLDAPTDEMECACPVLRRLAIKLNDGPWWKGNLDRTDYLRPLIPLLLDSRGSRDLTLRRAFKIVDITVRQITPIGLEKRFPEHAKNLRELPEIKDKVSAGHVRKVARSAAADAAADAKTQIRDLLLQAFREVAELKD